MPRMTIINADDFGLSASANRAISDAFIKGLISDTTLLANGEAFEETAALAAENGFSDKIGIHFNLTEGVPLTEEITNFPSFCENGVFHGHINRTKLLSRAEKTAVYRELRAQAQKMKRTGFNIDHADSHHHIHTAVFVAPVVFDICREFEISKIRLHRNIGNIPAYKKPVKRIYNRNLIKNGFKTTDHFGSLTDVGGTNVTGSLEIMVHPDYDAGGTLIDRRSFVDGFPAGVPLACIRRENIISLSSYGDL